MLLKYQAIDRSGSPRVDNIEAPDARAAVERLRSRGLYVTAIDPKEAPRKRSALTAFLEVRGLNHASTATFTRTSLQGQSQKSTGKSSPEPRPNKKKSPGGR